MINWKQSGAEFLQHGKVVSAPSRIYQGLRDEKPAMAMAMGWKEEGGGGRGSINKQMQGKGAFVVVLVHLLVQTAG